MDLDALEALCARGDIGTAVLTGGTTGFGAVDPIEEALALRERYGVRIHVDAAYGGFFRLLDDAPSGLRAIESADSVVIDPHKHGLQPYGCGAVMFKDPRVGRFYAHDSPFTYFTSDELHLGEISLECSRAGAAAAALWLTLRAVPLKPFVEAARRAALAFAERLRASDSLRLHLDPELDIVTYLPPAASVSELDAASAAILHAGMADPEDPVFLSTVRVDAEHLARHGLEADAPSARILRSVLMKPEHEAATDWLASRVEKLATAEPLVHRGVVEQREVVRGADVQRLLRPVAGAGLEHEPVADHARHRMVGAARDRRGDEAVAGVLEQRDLLAGGRAQRLGVAVAPVLVDQRAAPHVADPGAAAAQEAREGPRLTASPRARRPRSGPPTRAARRCAASRARPRASRAASSRRRRGRRYAPPARPSSAR